MKASVTNPYKNYWSASVTLGNDINGTGDTIEKAYNDLTNRIWFSPYLFSKFMKKTESIDDDFCGANSQYRLEDKSVEQPSVSVQEAAEHYRKVECGADKTERYLEKAFIAGAEWQKQQAK